jgi:protoporphyrin/coproporphyrin ferrochelatase
MSDHRIGILLLAHGGPDRLDDIEPFLRNIRGGRGFSPKLLEEITDRYRQIGGRSPILEISQRQAAALERELAADGSNPRVYLGMRNWHPFIRETMQQIKRDGITHLIAMCLAPQNSRMSVGLYFQHVKDAEKEVGIDAPITFIESWHDEPLLIDAFADKLRAALAQFSPADAPEVIFTAHSLPEKILTDGDPYDRQTRETATAVAQHCGLTNWRFAYQSQGATSDPWMGPTVESTLEQLGRQGCRHVVIAPIGFLCDHIEILYDIDILFRKVASQHGIELRRTESLNDSPKLIAAMKHVVGGNLAGERR